MSNDGFYSLLDDDDDDDDVETAGYGLVIGQPCATGEELNAREEAYRFGFNVPVLFEDSDDGVNYHVGNAVEMAEAMGVDPEGLTVEQVHDWLRAEAAKHGETWAVRYDSRN
jgi:hypothetical protein